MKKRVIVIVTKILLVCLTLGLISSFILEFKVNANELTGQKENLVEEILKNKPEFFGDILKEPDKYEVQILYTQIDRDSNNVPSFKPFKYRVDKGKYFYPASSVKLSACVLALEKLNNLGIDKNSPLIIEKGRPSQSAVYKDNAVKSNIPTIASYIKKVLVASDNDGFDRLYEFLGQQYYNETLWQKGYKDVLILHRLGNLMSFEENRYTNPMEFYNKGKIIYRQPMMYNDKVYKNNIIGMKKGKGYKSGGRYINEPKDFSKANYISIECLQEILKAIIFPEILKEERSFNLKEEDYEFLKKHMCMLPRECDNPKYNLKDSYGKYFIYGDSSNSIPQSVKIYNKTGRAYGYLVDNAYIVDESKGIEFFLTAVIYSNKNEIFNDEKYEYDTVGVPFMANLGREIYKYEENRKKV